jgi:flavodoxin
MSSELVPRRGIVIYDSRFGNTEKIARALERGLARSGVETRCVNAKEINLESINEFDLVAVGAPTEWLTASKAMKEFLTNLESLDLRGKWGFAFDTKLDRWFSGSAAGRIERYLKKSRLSLIEPRESAIVYRTDNSMSSMGLTDGEEKRFEEIGAKIGAAVKSRIVITA